ncbi:MAG: Clp protease N-terminal domain-containing protein [Acidimicrobiales bacterium]
MFDRFDADIRSIVDGALAESRRRGHSWLGTEHILLALARRRDLLGPEVAGLLPDAEAIATALDAALGLPSHRDEELLAAVGVDLDAIRSAIRRTFGDSALDDLGRRRVHQPWQPWRRPTRRCMSILAGSTSIAPRLKRAFEHAQREAERRARATIDPAALLLGMMEVEDAMCNRLLYRIGVDTNALGQALRAAGG